LNGESLGNWTDFFRKIYKQSQDMLINEDISLIMLQNQPEQWDICSESDIGIFTNVYVSATTFVMETLTLGIAINGKQYSPIFVNTLTYVSNATTLGFLVDTSVVIKDT
jgi:hypothetical protein